MGLKLVAELGLDGKGYATGLNQAKGMAEGFAHGLKSIVVQAVGVYAIEQAMHKTVETARELVDASERLSIAPKQLQILSQAAKNAGTDLGTVEGAMEKLGMAVQKWRGHDMGMRRAFSAMGISPGQLEGPGALSTSQLFMGPMAQFAQGHNAAEIGVVFREVLGKGFGPMVSVLKTDFSALGDKMQMLGTIMDTETAVKLKHITDEFSLLGMIITTQLGPAMIKLSEWIYENILKTGRSVAGVSASLGAGTAQMGPIKAAATIAAGVLAGPGTLINSKGFDKKAAGAALIEAEKPWNARLGDFQKFLDRMKEMAHELDNPKPAAQTGSLMGSKLLMAAEDPLVRVGNFLGGKGASLTTVADHLKDHTAILRQIALNTHHQIMANAAHNGNPFQPAGVGADAWFPPH